ncbi:MAG: hypothetical protein GKR91_07115 [Pseudomonadales bacterium]|nr:hypothetical protein [Pseudomonadales bacterium]
MAVESVCPSCGAVTKGQDGPVHRYLESSPGCWAAYGEVLAREYSNFAYARNHRLTVDAYALQHPGSPSPQTISSAAVHLASLCQILEHGLAFQSTTEFMQKFAQHKSSFDWLEPPTDMGTITVMNVLAAESGEDHLKQVEAWAEAIWAAWHQHHDQINNWINQYG